MPKLTQALVTRYAKYQALKNLLDDWLEEQKKLIKAALKRAKCPDLGPFLIELGEAQNGPNWKNEFTLYLRGKGLDNRTILIFFTQLAAKPRNKKKQPRLYCKRNPNYKRKFPIRLPA
jgi:hypothetical protein